MNRPIARAAALLLVPLSLRAQTTKNDPHETPEVRKLVTRGVKNVDQHDLEKSISTTASQCKNLFFEPFCLFSHSPTVEEKHYLDHSELKRDVLRIRVYYWKRGFRDTEVDTAITRIGPNQVEVTFDIKENEPTRVRKIAIEYDSTLISDKVRNRLTRLHAKDPLNLVQLDSMRLMFQVELWNQGFGDGTVDTTVTLNPPDSMTADVLLRLIPNRLTTIGTINVIGNERVGRSTILNSLIIRPGGLYRQGDVLESQRNLYESSLFRLATIDVPLRRDSVKNVNISVIEAPLHEMHAGGGVTNVDFFQVDAGYTAYNLFGGARRLDINGTLGNLLASSMSGRGFFRNVRADVPDTSSVSSYLSPTWAASVDFRQPSFLRRPANTFGVGIFGHRKSTPGIFIDNGYGATGTFTRQIAIRAPASVNYRYEINRVQASDVYFCVNYGVCDNTTIGTLRKNASLSPLSLTGFIDRSDIPFNPTKGYTAQVDFEHASAFTASDYRYNRAFVNAAAYTHRTGSMTVYSAHLRFGFVRALGSTQGGIGVLHPRKRFYAGGAQSVRGFAENQLGPRILTVAPEKLRNAITGTGLPCDTVSEAIRQCNPNTGGLKDVDFRPQALGGTSLLEGSVEWRFPLWFLYRHVSGAVFIDGGVIGSSSLQSFTDFASVTKGTGAITPGFGLRYDSPVGPIRFDVGINPRTSEELTVVTSIVQNGQRKILPLAIQRGYSPAGRTLLDRLTLHFSIGQAY